MPVRRLVEVEQAGSTHRRVADYDNPAHGVAVYLPYKVRVAHSMTMENPGRVME